MSGQRWLAYAGEEGWADVERAAASVGAGTLERATSADDLRERAQLAEGDCCVLVGRTDQGVSDVNLAAAVVADGVAGRVVLVGRGVSGSLRSRAARAGVELVIDAQELPPEVPGPRPRREARRSATPTLALEEGARRAPVVTMVSGRGGVGKTALVAMAAATAASWGMRVVTIDLDLSCGNLASCYGVAHAGDLSRAALASQAAATDIEGVDCAERVTQFGPCERPENAELAYPMVRGLIERSAAESDLVLVDTSTTFTDATAQAAQASDRLMIVTDGRPGSLSAMSRVAGLAVRLGVARTRIARIENRAGLKAAPNYTLGRAEVGLEAATVFQVKEGHAEVSDYLASGQVTDLVGSGSPFAESVAMMLARLLSELGALPDNAEAQRSAREGSSPARGWALLRRRREAR